jgi:hypothetical protein
MYSYVLPLKRPGDLIDGMDMSGMANNPELAAHICSPPPQPRTTLISSFVGRGLRHFMAGSDLPTVPMPKVLEKEGQATSGLPRQL